MPELLPELSFATGYGLLLLGPAAEACRLLRTGQTRGLSPVWLAALLAGLACLQYSMTARDQHPAVLWGNARKSRSQGSSSESGENCSLVHPRRLG